MREPKDAAEAAGRLLQFFYFFDRIVRSADNHTAACDHPIDRHFFDRLLGIFLELESRTERRDKIFPGSSGSRRRGYRSALPRGFQQDESGTLTASLCAPP